MALPPGFLDELRARTPLPGLIGRKTRLLKSGRNWKGCCPFHGEKTPSFYVYDDHFHCFGCGAHGDAVTFVMQAEGAQFMEAVERLAGEAGLEVPKLAPRDAERARQARDLYTVMEAAMEAFQRRLRLPEGRPALEYLRRRGLSDETIQGFGLGWAGSGRGALQADLKQDAFEPSQLIEAGLLKQPEGDEAPRDFFFNRVMFPIRDRRGRVIGIEVKASATVRPQDLRGLRQLQAAVGDKFVQGLVLHDHDRITPFDEKLHAAPVSMLWQGATKPTPQASTTPFIRRG
jgi:DNA primase